MEPKIALCNIFDQDGARLAAFARQHGFTAIDWTVDPDLSEQRFLSEIGHLDGLEVRYHCRFFDHEIACCGRAGVRALEVYRGVIQKIRAAGGKFMTLHIGLGRRNGDGLDLGCALENLKTLVCAGQQAGIQICLENLASGWTSDPDLFHDLVLGSGAGVTIDFGHVLAAAPGNGSSVFKRFIAPFRDRVQNCHIYHQELPEIGHTPPAGLDDIYPRLHLIRTRTFCRWWVIELQTPEEILHTRALIEAFLNNADRTSGVCAAQG